MCTSSWKRRNEIRKKACEKVLSRYDALLGSLTGEHPTDSKDDSCEKHLEWKEKP